MVNLGPKFRWHVIVSADAPQCHLSPGEAVNRRWELLPLGQSETRQYALADQPSVNIMSRSIVPGSPPCPKFCMIMRFRSVLTNWLSTRTRHFQQAELTTALIRCLTAHRSGGGAGAEYERGGRS
jgi:hypothetical protein